MAASDRFSSFPLSLNETIFSITSPIQRSIRRTRKDSMSNLGHPAIQIPQCSMHAPEQRVLDLVIVQICQQLGMERFKSYKIIRLLSNVLLLRIRSLCLQIKFIYETLSYLPMSSESIIKAFLVRSGELSSNILNPEENQPFTFHFISPAFSELLGYAIAQNSWISSLMGRLASIPDTPSVSRRMLPPEALLTLFTTLPRSFRDVSKYSNNQEEMAIGDSSFVISKEQLESLSTNSQRITGTNELIKVEKTEEENDDKEMGEEEAKCGI